MTIKTAITERKKLSLKPWITKGIYTSIKTKNRLFRTCYKHGDSNKLLLYKSYSNKLTHLKKISKRQYYNNLFNEHRNNKTETWKIKSRLNKIFQKQLQLANRNIKLTLKNLPI